MARADFEHAKALYPSCDMGIAGWLKFFDTPAGEDAVGKVIYDIYDEVKAAEERRAGTHKMGRRARREARALDEVFAIVFPQQYTNEPLTVALKQLIGHRKQAAFAAKVPCSQPVLSRILSGEHKPNLLMIERLSEAAGVNPWYFAEWRAMYLGELITAVLLERPHMSITAINNVRKARRRETT